jgi:predicted dehydrogenase/threonine dehydrogenase-like Zn-dependent dehydrogenase
MKQVFFNSAGQVVVEEVPAPTLLPGGVLVRVEYSLISTGTESMAQSESTGVVGRALKSPELVKKVIDRARTVGVQETARLVKQKLQNEAILPLSITGYSAAGRVIAKDEAVTDLQVGDRVACAGAKYASHAEIITAPRNLAAPVPTGVSGQAAAFTTLGAIAMQGVRRAGVQMGETVAVVGLGLIGQLTCQLLRVAGCRVIGLDLNRKRVELAQRLGLDYNLVTGEVDGLNMVKLFTEGVGADAVLLCAGTASSQPVNQAFQMARERGRIVIVGAVGMNLERADFYHKEQDLLISRSYGPGRYDPTYEEHGLDYPLGYVRWTENRNMAEFLRQISEGKIDVDRLISAEFPVTEAARAYASLSTGAGVATLLHYPPAEAEEVVSTITWLDQVKPVDTETIPLAIVGPGSFTQAVHLPNIGKIDALTVRAIVGKTGITAQQIARHAKAAYATTNFQEVLADDNIQAVFITTRHNLHASMCVAAAQAKKHIFVEKPMGLTIEECEAVKAAVQENQVSLMVGFNRRFSPLIMRLKEDLQHRNGPVMLNYRVNAGSLPKGHWAVDPVEGGGRTLGEGVHFFDLFYWFIEAEPVSLASRAISGGQGNVVGDDNLVVTLKYADGSVASLFYSCVGHTAAGKERLELFFDGKSAVLDDYKVLEGYGMPRLAMSLKQADKGHYDELVHFVQLLKSGPSPLLPGVDDGYRATLCAIKALESLQSGNVVSF